MKTGLFTLIGGMFLFTSVSVSAYEIYPQAVAAKAISQLGQEMRKKLAESMQKNGPAVAIEVCAKDAPNISSRIEKELGVTIKRTSLKIRNPRNAPDLDEKYILKTLASLFKAGGELPLGVTPFPNNHRRFYKTIIVEQACLKCHGDSIKMDKLVRSEIIAMYPNDKAIDYKEGELRGIISVYIK
ncbi:MAG: DUF3365 domain-containing protein [Desulfuromonadaceae bacterium]|nr:DUF3365 domain-containing protein [Desulfuromonadaceae bacterium]